MSDWLVIFDCDGVLVDSEVIACRIVAEELSKQGFSITYEEYVHGFAGRSRASLITHVENAIGKALPGDFADHLETLILDAFSAGLKRVGGIEKVLDAAPFRCVASSSSIRRVQHALNVTSLAPYFATSDIFSGTMVAQSKPWPDLFLLAAQEKGAAPQQCIVIEDSRAGVKAAKAANMICLAYIGGEHTASEGYGDELKTLGADAIFSDMMDLAEYLSSATTG